MSSTQTQAWLVARQLKINTRTYCNVQLLESASSRCDEIVLLCFCILKVSWCIANELIYSSRSVITALPGAVAKKLGPLR